MNLIKELWNKILKFFFHELMNENKQESHKSQNTKYDYYKRKLLTDYEKKFYTKLKGIENEGNFICLPQINLATVISKSSKYRNELFRNVDFGIFDNDFNLLLLIELNDKTHNQYNRKKRDRKVREICQNVGIRLITFYTQYPNEKSYIINRVLKAINEDRSINDKKEN